MKNQKKKKNSGKPVRKKKTVRKVGHEKRSVAKEKNAVYPWRNGISQLAD